MEKLFWFKRALIMLVNTQKQLFEHLNRKIFKILTNLIHSTNTVLLLNAID